MVGMKFKIKEGSVFFTEPSFYFCKKIVIKLLVIELF